MNIPRCAAHFRREDVVAPSMTKPRPRTTRFACPGFINSLKRVFDEEVSLITMGRGPWGGGCDPEGISVSLPDLAHAEANWTLVGFISVIVR